MCGKIAETLQTLITTDSCLFEPFYTTKKPGDGVGLGLAISSGIIKDLGGRLVAKNNETKGATFEIYLPLKHN